MVIDGNLDKRLMVTEVVLQKLSAINAIIWGESGSWLFHHISAPADRSGLVQLHPQLFCLSDLSISLPISMYYPFPEYESHVEGTQVTVCRRDKWGWYGVPLGRWRKPKLNAAVVWPLAEMCDSERKPGSKAVRSKSGCGNNYTGRNSQAFWLCYGYMNIDILEVSGLKEKLRTHAGM